MWVFLRFWFEVEVNFFHREKLCRRDCLDYLKNRAKSGDMAVLELMVRNVSLGKWSKNWSCYRHEFCIEIRRKSNSRGANLHLKVFDLKIDQPCLYDWNRMFLSHVIATFGSNRIDTVDRVVKVEELMWPAKKWGDTEIAERGRSMLVMRARYTSAELTPHQRGWTDAGW